MATYVRLFGAPVVEHDGRTIMLRPERRHQLAAWLALRGAPVARDQLGALFWPDRDNASARRNLRRIAFDVEAFDWTEGFSGDRATLAWPVATDVADFERALEQGRRDDALRLYRGPLCEGLEDAHNNALAEALGFERTRLAERWRSTVLAALDGAEAQQRLALAQRLLAADAFDEEAIAAALAAHAALGRSSEALRLYRAFKERLAEALGIEPSARLRELARRLEAGGETQAAAPVPSAGFVGRTSELAELQALIARDECRLLTVTGPGGIGKSRLAKAAIAALEPRFAGGIGWIPLDDLSEAAQVAPRIAQVLAIELTPQASALDAIAAYLAARQMLLVLDNAEQIAGLAALAERLLAAAPRLKLLATSRHRLNAQGEWLLPLGGLAVPPPGTGDAAALEFDAARLFVLRARAAQPAFDATRATESIARLVRALGGLPLAIELAAHWVRLLPVPQIEAEVAASLDVLERAEEGDERPEHRSVRATFEQSWRLLAPRERTLFAVLSVFRSPFTRAAASAVSGEPLAAFAALADKSLVRCEEDGRFALHPLLAQFAGEKLARDPAAAAAARQRHAEHYCRALAAYESWHTVDQRQAIATVTRELSDVLAAYRWALAHGQAQLVQTTIGVLGYFYELGGRLDEGLAVLSEVDATLTASTRPQLLARAQAALSRAMIEYRAAAFARCIDEGKRALQQYRIARDARGVRAAMTVVVAGLTKIGRYDEARRYCEQGLRSAEQAGDRENLALFLNNLGLIESQCGYPDRAVPLYERALALTRASGDRSGVIAQLNNISAALIASSAPAAALPYLHDGLRLTDEAGFVAQRSYFLANLAQASFDAGDAAAARRWAEEGLESVRRGSDRSSMPGCLIVLGRVAHAQGRLAEARQRLREAAQLAADMQLRRFMVRAVLAGAALCFDAGRPGEGARLLGCVCACGLANRIETARAEKLLAEARVRFGDEAVDGPTADGRRLALDTALAQVAAGVA